MDPLERNTIDVQETGIVSYHERDQMTAHASRKNGKDFPSPGREQGQARGRVVVVWHTSHPCEWPSGARPPNNRYMRSKWPPETPPTLPISLYIPSQRAPHPRALSTSLSRMPPKLFNFKTRQPLTANQAILLLQSVSQGRTCDIYEMWSVHWRTLR